MVTTYLNEGTAMNGIINSIKPIFEKNPASKMVEAYSALNQLCEELLLHALQKMGIFQHANESYSSQSLKTTLKILPKYESLWNALLEILIYAGYLEKHSDQIRCTSSIDKKNITIQSLEKSKQNLLHTYPEMQAFIDLLVPCVTHLPEILIGETMATDILFPDFSMELVENVYKIHPTTAYCNQLVAHTTLAYIERGLSKLNSTEKVQIVEVGAGTGGTSSAVLNTIDAYANKIEYFYTDISRVFLNHAKEAFLKKHPYMNLKLLNIEKPIIEQGYNAQSVDIVIAANVLHATKNIDHTLKQITDLLKPGGCLILNEVMGVEHFTTLTFGLLEGWWIFEDSKARLPGSPLLSPELWKKQLQSAGFQNPTALGEFDGSKKQPGYSALDVIVAERGIAQTA